MSIDAGRQNQCRVASTRPSKGPPMKITPSPLRSQALALRLLTSDHLAFCAALVALASLFVRLLVPGADGQAFALNLASDASAQIVLASVISAAPDSSGTTTWSTPTPDRSAAEPPTSPHARTGPTASHQQTVIGVAFVALAVGFFAGRGSRQ